MDAFSKLMAKLTGIARFTMRADAMQPTIMPGDTIVASEGPYRDADPLPGDIIVFSYPTNTSVAFVSRVIAVGDTTIEVRNGLTLVGGHSVREGYAPDGEKRDARLT
ncbi:MAG: signal peptidase I [Steroidobacteraceae bacterium]